MRRRAQLAEVRRDVAAVEFRGNLDTRLEKVNKGVVQAAILAAAGMERLGVRIDEAMILDPQWWVPAPGQGVLAVEIMEDRTDVATLLAPLNDRAAEIELNAERAFSARLEGGCSVPLGCTAVVDGSTVVLSGYLGALDGRAIRESLSGSVDEGVEMGVELAEAILVSGGEQILSEIEARTAPVVEQP
jgi:hydroxymethylbilane synthase